MKVYYKKGFQSAEYLFGWGLLFVCLLIRSIYVFSYPFDSDESQHLHIIWGWTQGMVQYKDFFDNHMPLFHLIFIPVLGFIGERADILYIMRFVMFPFFFLALYLVYLLGKNLYSNRIGICSALALCFFPRFFFKSLEFRSDNLWMVLWLLVLVVLIKGKLSLKKIFFAGVLFGLLFAVSLKTILLSSMLLFSVFISLLIVWAGGYKIEWEKFIKMVFIAAMGCFSVLCFLIIFFIYNNALSEMFYGTIKHNILSEIKATPLPQYLFPITLPVVVMFSFFEKRNSATTDLLVKRISFMLLGPLCFFGLISFWPVFSQQDLLPIIPVLTVFFTYLIVEKIFPVFNIKKFIVPVFVIFSLLEMIYILFSFPLKNNESKYTEDRLKQILNLVKPGEYIMDLKGEAIFRPRPFYYVLETVTRDLILKGVIKDTIQEDIIQKKCYVALHDSKRFPEKTRKFLNDNFISVGLVRAAGKIIGETSNVNKILKFNIAIPGMYAIVTTSGLPKGRLDNIDYSGPVEMNAGEHEFYSETINDVCAVVWAPALERGFSPFEQYKN